MDISLYGVNSRAASVSLLLVSRPPASCSQSILMAAAMGQTPRVSNIQLEVEISSAARRRWTICPLLERPLYPLANGSGLGMAIRAQVTSFSTRRLLLSRPRAWMTRKSKLAGCKEKWFLAMNNLYIRIHYMVDSNSLDSNVYVRLGNPLLIANCPFQSLIKTSAQLLRKFGMNECIQGFLCLLTSSWGDLGRWYEFQYWYRLQDLSDILAPIACHVTFGLQIQISRQKMSSKYTKAGNENRTVLAKREPWKSYPLIQRIIIKLVPRISNEQLKKHFSFFNIVQCWCSGSRVWHITWCVRSVYELSSLFFSLKVNNKSLKT